MTTDKPDQTRLELARGYLAEYLADEDIPVGSPRQPWKVGMTAPRRLLRLGTLQESDMSSSRRPHASYKRIDRQLESAPAGTSLGERQRAVHIYFDQGLDRDDR